ncbi:MAG: hypothetical protein DRJ63_03410 [Thermoprotei archaeon]|nr:MAG: hypothetical protein DRJ63_03410 [Thermoprotei archaeon]
MRNAVFALLDSKVKYATLVELVKAYLVDYPVSARKIVSVYRVDPATTYEFLRKMYRKGIVVKRSRGYILSDGKVSRKILELVETVLEEESDERGLKSSLRVLYTRVPSTLYYVSDPTVFRQYWLGKIESPLIFIDRVLERRVKLDEPKVVYVSLRGRDYVFSWEGLYSGFSIVASPEQSYADYLSYVTKSEYQSILVDILWSRKLNWNKLLSKCSKRGLKLASAILLYKYMITGRAPAVDVRFEALADYTAIEEIVPLATPWLFTNGEDYRRNI